jgi:hypothetical protein
LENMYLSSRCWEICIQQGQLSKWALGKLLGRRYNFFS